MSSMSYCRLRNARDDIQAAVDDLLDDEDDYTLSDEELQAAIRIIELAAELDELVNNGPS